MIKNHSWNGPKFYPVSSCQNVQIVCQKELQFSLGFQRIGSLKLGKTDLVYHSIYELLKGLQAEDKFGGFSLNTRSQHFIQRTMLLQSFHWQIETVYVCPLCAVKKEKG